MYKCKVGKLCVIGGIPFSNSLTPSNIHKQTLVAANVNESHLGQHIRLNSAHKKVMRDVERKEASG